MTDGTDFTTKIRNPFLQTYLKYVEHTEAPRIMHLWAALTTASACLGRHCFFTFGVGNIYPNIYTLLVGPPATKKNTAIALASELAAEVTKVNFAPDDTAGQRQGLISAIEKGGETVDFEKLSIEAQLEALTNIDATFSSPDRHAIFIEAREWGSFIGQNNMDLIRFLVKIYDGDSYRYTLKKDRIVLKDTCCTMLGGTTPTEISLLLPPEAIGQGFMSRCILVHGAKKYKSVFRPALDEDAKQVIKDTYKHLWHNCHGPLLEDAEARVHFEKLHQFPLQINDTRFVYYSERRSTHLIKLSLILAACRKSDHIQAQDVAEAHFILCETEKNMPDALGEYGLSINAKARQRLLEYIQHANSPVTVDLLWAIMQKDMRNKRDFVDVLNAFIQTGRVKKVETAKGTMVVYNEDRRDEVIELFEQGN